MIVYFVSISEHLLFYQSNVFSLQTSFFNHFFIVNIWLHVAHLHLSWGHFSVHRLLPTRPNGPSWSSSQHVRVFVCLCVWCPLPMQFFFRLLIDPQMTWPDPGLSLVNPRSLPYGGGGGGGVFFWCLPLGSLHKGAVHFSHKLFVPTLGMRTIKNPSSFDY